MELGSDRLSIKYLDRHHSQVDVVIYFLGEALVGFRSLVEEESTY